MLEDQANEAVAKCDIWLCKFTVIQKCGRACHWACCNGIILVVKDKPNLASLLALRSVTPSLQRNPMEVNEAIERTMESHQVAFRLVVETSQA